jgi:hypothetical protein
MASLENAFQFSGLGHYKNIDQIKNQVSKVPRYSFKFNGNLIQDYQPY